MLWSCRRLAGGKQMPTGHLHLDGFESYDRKKEETSCWMPLLFLVDDIGLEPMTFRTSSGCSSQLS